MIEVALREKALELRLAVARVIRELEQQHVTSLETAVGWACRPTESYGLEPSTMRGDWSHAPEEGLPHC